VLGADSECVKSDVSPKVVELCSDKNWRVRWAVMMKVPELATGHDLSSFVSTFLPGEKAFLQLATDNCARIRTDWVLVCVTLLESYGDAFIMEHVLPTIKKAHEQAPYQQKMVVLLAMQGLGAALQPDARNKLINELFPMALTYAKDRVPNLQLLAFQTFRFLVEKKLLESEELKEKVKSHTEGHKDSDPDVAEEAEALKKLLS